jgi:nitrate reductase alpha subunit
LEIPDADEQDQRPKMPMGSSGFRWGREKGQWNLLLRDPVDSTGIHPALTFLHAHE